MKTRIQWLILASQIVCMITAAVTLANALLKV
jgi:hypothetical protein